MKWLRWLPVVGLLIAGPTAASPPVQICIDDTCGIIPVVSAAAEASHVLKATPGFLYAVYVSNPNAAGFLMIFNSATVPNDGAVTPIECVPVSAGNTAFVNYLPGPPGLYTTGISAALSSTGCFVKTTVPTGFFHALVQ